MPGYLNLCLEYVSLGTGTTLVFEPRLSLCCKIAGKELNHSNAEAIFVQSTGMQSFLKNI